MLLGLFKNVDGCISDPLKVVHFRRIRHGCGIIFGESEQHSCLCICFSICFLNGGVRVISHAPRLIHQVAPPTSTKHKYRVTLLIHQSLLGRCEGILNCFSFGFQLGFVIVLWCSYGRKMWSSGVHEIHYLHVCVCICIL